MKHQPPTVILAAAASAAMALSGCQKTDQSNGQNGADETETASAEAGFDALHDLVIELIRRREFNAALVGIDHMDDLRDEVSLDKARQIEALRAALSAAQSGPRSEPDPAPRTAPITDPPRADPYPTDPDIRDPG